MHTFIMTTLWCDMIHSWQISFQSKLRESRCQSGRDRRVCSGPALHCPHACSPARRRTSAPCLVQSLVNLLWSWDRRRSGGAPAESCEEEGGGRQTEDLETLSRDRIFSLGWWRARYLGGFKVCLHWKSNHRWSVAVVTVRSVAPGGMLYKLSSSILQLVKGTRESWVCFRLSVMVH